MQRGKVVVPYFGKMISITSFPLNPLPKKTVGRLNLSVWAKEIQNAVKLAGMFLARIAITIGAAGAPISPPTFGVKLMLGSSSSLLANTETFGLKYKFVHPLSVRVLNFDHRASGKYPRLPSIIQNTSV